MPLSSDLHALRDPAAPRRLGALVLAAVVLWPLFQGAGFSLGALFDPGNLQVIGRFLATFLPPETGRDFLGYLGRATLETLAIATAGMALAFVLAVPLAYLVTGAARERRALNPVTRGLLTILRGVPELVWALVFVRVFGLGPAAGVLALGLTYGGMLAKVYAEILESADPAPARALAQAGARRPLAMLYGLLPQAARELTSYTVYRWECAIRASVVMGFVGAGGLGQLMDQAMKMLNGGEASTILLTFMLLVWGADLLSRGLRRALDTPPAARASAWGWRSALTCAALALGVVASFAMLEMDLPSLFTGAAGRSMLEFVISFFPPDTSAEWLRKVAVGVWETLAISVVGTLLAAVLGLLLALPRWRAPWSLVLNVLRSVPELVWATITALAVGLGPFAGALALALHTAGVLGRLYAEALQNQPAAPTQALRLSGSGRAMAFLYATLPGAAPQLLAYTLYRWEMNIRMAAILGFVGAGGLGQLLYFELSLFHYAQASTVIIAMLALSVAVDWASAALRRRMG
ncbi:phosphonate ABC transporter, permease protein PhnE [Delftia acidovorans]|uniref:PhnE/PtxC family ABC transporter permease n=1 Tax=Delftia TaxID=80865 RepID=UPI0004FF663C|nr:MULTISPECIES: phosphate/phosphonate ABC transporter permease [Delftia]KFJ09618.1 phosphonate ABC transporter, permease protein PhnE [Delftia acidovorans]MCA1067014.1 Phosphate-import permease protein PhnE [Delftia acidovorans]MCG8985659.1 phosphate/phosphonate ABC transporter permease [Delftia acidovorans]OWG18907.1 phosphonate ABC transporter permease [Delftia sp. K82]QQB52675.1 phosphate/phosphonate ABC transporter permease [Delftia acidovorans]